MSLGVPAGTDDAIVPVTVRLPRSPGSRLAEDGAARPVREPGNLGGGRREEWRDLPSGTATLAAEATEWKKRFTPAASPEVGPGGQGEVEE